MRIKNLSYSTVALTPWHWGWAFSIAAIVIIVILFRHALPIRDGDIWFHMLYGKHIIDINSLIVDHTIFSWTPSTNDNIYCSWLSQIFLYLIYKYCGLSGLFVFQYIGICLLPFGCYLHAKKLNVVNHPVAWLLCLLAVIMSYTAIHTKPEIFSYIFITLSVWNFWHIRHCGSVAWKNCYLFPIIMLAWVNSHGGFIFGCVLFIVIAIGELLNIVFIPEKALSNSLRKHFFVSLFFTLIAIFLTPYGYKYPLYLFSVLLPTSENIEVLKEVSSYDSPFALANFANLALAANLSIFFLIALLLRNLKRLEWTIILANLLFVFLFTRMYRTTFYWPPILLFSAINLLSLNPIISQNWRNAEKLTKWLPRLVFSIAFLVAGFTVYKSALFPERWLWMGFGISESIPISETDYIKKYYPKSRICNSYNLGSYFLWELWPDNKVFLDARHFPYRDWINEYFALVANPKEKLAAFSKKFPCEVWWVSIFDSELILELLASQEWRLAFYGKTSAVLVRKDIPLPQPAFRASEEIFNLKSLATVIEVITFAASIGDWGTAERLLENAKQNYFKTEMRETILQWYSHFVIGLQAYYERDYRRSAAVLAKLENSNQIDIRKLYINSLLFLARDSWHKGDVTTTRKFLLEAYNSDQGDRISLMYNLGVVEWWHQTNGTHSPIESVNLRNDKAENNRWRFFLAEYIRRGREKQDLKFDFFRQTAITILSGGKVNRPTLICPEEPIHRNFLAGEL